MIKQSQIIISNNPSMMYNLLSMGFKVFLCTEDMYIPPEVVNHPNCIKVSVLLPPYEALSAELNRDMNTMSILYTQYLSTNPSAVSILGMMHIGLYQGTPLCICFGSEAKDLEFWKVLLDYIRKAYGIVFAELGNIGGYIDTSYVPITLYNLYVMKELTAAQVLVMYPSDIDFTIPMMNALSAEIGHPTEVNDYQSLNNYFKAMAGSMNGSFTNASGQNLRSPFTFGG